jgi:hypothetical protein
MKKLSAIILSLACVSFPVAAENLISNGDFEADAMGTQLLISSSTGVNDPTTIDSKTFTDWRFFSVGAPSINGFKGTIVDAGSYAGGKPGSHALRLDVNNTGTPVGSDYALDRDNENAGRVEVAYGNTYTFSFDADLDGVTGGAFALDVVLAEYDGDGNATLTGQTLFTLALPADAHFHSYSYTWTPSSSATTRLNIAFRPKSPGFASALVLDNVQLRQATTGGAAQPATRQRTAAVLGAGLPGEDAALVVACSETLQQAGYSVVKLDADGLCNQTTLNPGKIDLLVLPNAGVLPTASTKAMDRFLKAGGNLIALGAPLWQESLIKVEGKWITREENLSGKASGALQNPIFSFPPDERKSWTRSTDKPENPASYDFLPNGPVPGHGSLQVKITDAMGWDTLYSPKRTGLFPPGHSLTLIMAKGDGKTGSISVEWNEKDNSRWIAVIPLTAKWCQHVLRPEDFKYWNSNPLRGGAGDKFNPENATSIAIGVANSHTGVNPGPHEYWVGPIGTAAMTPEMQNSLNELTANNPLVLDTVSPGYKFFPCTQTDKLTVRADQTMVSTGELPFAETLSTSPRPGGGGFNKGRGWRWISLVEATGGGEWRGNPVTLMVNTDGSYKGGIWAAFGVKGAAWYKSAAVQKLIGEIATRMQNGIFMVDGGANFYTYFEDQSLTLGIRAANVGRVSGTVTGRVVVTDGDTGKQAAIKEWNLKVSPGKTVAVSSDWKPAAWPKAGFKITAELVSDGKVIDRVSHEAFVWTPKAKKDFVTIKDGHFSLAGKRWRINGLNYMPSSGIACENNDYFEKWLQAAAYDPEVIERDLRHIKDMGINALSIFTYHSSIGDQNLIDILRRMDGYGMKANVSLRPGTPMEFLWPQMKEIIEHYRLQENDTVFAYDLAWEPWLFAHELRKPFDADWEQWIIERYGSVANAERDWGYPVPRDPLGKVTNPFPQSSNGDWTRMFAAYRRFCDTILYKKYDAARRLVKSIDANHYVSCRISDAGNPTFKTTDSLPYDFPYLATAQDFLEPEGYGRIGAKWDDVKPGIFEYEYARWAAPTKPMFWAEAGCSSWNIGTMSSDENNLAYVGKFYDLFYRMLIASGSDGVFFWWYPGGYRFDEKSDYGIINSDGTDRPTTKAIRANGAKFLAGPDAKPVDFWVEMDRDKHPDGIGAVYDEVKDTFWAAIAAGKTPGLRTAGTGTDSATCPLTAVGNTPYNGNNPLKYLDGAFDVVEIQGADGQWIAVTKGGSVPVKAGKPVKVRATLTNLGEAAWLAKGIGAVQLTLNGVAAVQSPLAATVPHQDSVTMAAEIALSGLKGESTLTLGLEAKSRAHFGEKFSFVLIPH